MNVFLTIPSVSRPSHLLTHPPTLMQVDSASAMISAARNLMSTVALVVRVCYLASTAIARAEGTIPVSLQ